MRSARILFLALVLGACTTPYPHIPPAPPKKFAEAETDLRQGHYVEAASGFQAFLNESRDPTYHPRAYYRLAQAEYALGNYEQTLDTLSDLKTEFPKQKGPQVPALQGDAYYALAQRTDAILQWDEAWNRANKRDREVLRPRLEKAISEIDSSTAFDLSQTVTAPEIQDMLAERGPLVAGGAMPAHTEGGEAALEDEPIEARAPQTTTTVADEVEGEPDSLGGERLGGSLTRVACLVQLTGPDQAYGWRALNGLRLAFDEQPDALAVRDTGGDPQTAAQLLRRLAADPTIVAVVGPQRSAESEAVAPLAEDLGLPVLLLSQREGLGGHSVLQAGVTQRQQAGTVIQYATSRLGATRFGVVYPDDGYGKAFLDAFSSEVRAHGATLVGSKGYTPSSRSFGSEIAAVRGWIDQQGLQAVFIPDAAPTATALATALRQVAPELVLLGSESWNDAPLIAQAGAAIDGAVFVDTFHPGGGDAATEDFVSRFRARSGTAPTVFEAQAYDAGMLVRGAIDNGALTRAALLDQLRTVRSYEGAGRLSAAPQGFQRELILLRARQGEIERVEPAAG